MALLCSHRLNVVFLQHGFWLWCFMFLLWAAAHINHCFLFLFCLSSGARASPSGSSGFVFAVADCTKWITLLMHRLIVGFFSFWHRSVVFCFSSAQVNCCLLFVTSWLLFFTFAVAPMVATAFISVVFLFLLLHHLEEVANFTSLRYCKHIAC